MPLAFWIFPPGSGSFLIVLKENGIVVSDILKWNCHKYFEMYQTLSFFRDNIFLNNVGRNNRD